MRVDEGLVWFVDHFLKKVFLCNFAMIRAPILTILKSQVSLRVPDATMGIMMTLAIFNLRDQNPHFQQPSSPHPIIITSPHKLHQSLHLPQQQPPHSITTHNNTPQQCQLYVPTPQSPSFSTYNFVIEPPVPFSLGYSSPRHLILPPSPLHSTPTYPASTPIDPIRPHGPYP